MLIISSVFRVSGFTVICLNGASPEKYLLLFCITSFLKFVKSGTNRHCSARYLSVQLHETEGFVLHRFDGKCLVTMINFAICIAMRNKWSVTDGGQRIREVKSLPPTLSMRMVWVDNARRMEVEECVVVIKGLIEGWREVRWTLWE